VGGNREVSPHGYTEALIPPSRRARVNLASQVGAERMSSPTRHELPFTWCWFYMVRDGAHGIGRSERATVANLYEPAYDQRTRRTPDTPSLRASAWVSTKEAPVAFAWSITEASTWRLRYVR